MPTLPKKKIGLISCSGEDLAEGLMSRLSTLKVLEDLRPSDTVTLCLPLFLAGDTKERAFAKVYPTIAIDGCPKQCAARATEFYSAKPARSIVISDLLSDLNITSLSSRRLLTKNEKNINDIIANQLANIVDELLSFKPIDKEEKNYFSEDLDVEINVKDDNKTATCECGLNLPILPVEINSNKIDVIGLPIIFELFYEQNKSSDTIPTNELIEKIGLYNKIPTKDEKYWVEALEREYKIYYKQKIREE